MNQTTLTWESDSILKINDVSFFVTCDGEELHSIHSTEDRFLLGTDRGRLLGHLYTSCGRGWLRRLGTRH